MKKVWSILAVLSMSLTALQAVETSVKQLSVDDFYKMKVYNNFDVSYRQSADSAGVIVIMASTEDISHVECVSKKGQLTIKYKGSSDKEQMQGAIIVYSTALEMLKITDWDRYRLFRLYRERRFRPKYWETVLFRLRKSIMAL